MKLRDFPLEPGGDTDIPQQFRGNQVMMILDYHFQNDGRDQQCLVVADGVMTRNEEEDTAALRRTVTAIQRKFGGSVLHTVTLRGVSRDACDFIQSAIPISVGPVHREQKTPRTVPIEMNVTRETFIELLRRSSRR